MPIGGAAFALFMLSQLNVDSDLNMARIYMFIMGASMGILMPLYSLLMQNSLPFRLLGVGTATNQFFRQMGAAMGISLFGAMIVSGFSSQLSKAFPDGFERLKEQPEILLNPDALQGFRQQLEQQSPGTAEGVIQAAREALAVPVTDVFLYGAIVMAIVLAIAVILPRVRFQTQEEMMAEARAAAAANRPPGGPPAVRQPRQTAVRPLPSRTLRDPRSSQVLQWEQSLRPLRAPKRRRTAEVVTECTNRRQ